MAKKVTYIISQTTKSLAFEWIATLLDRDRIELHFILLNTTDSPLEQYLKKQGIQTERIPYSGKSDLLPALVKTVRTLRKNKSDVVHTHLFEANLIGLTAAYLCGIKKRIYTRHHSDYHFLYHPKAVKYDKYIDRLATTIVAISDVTQQVLIDLEGVPAQKICKIHHGFDLDYFSHPDPKEVAELKTTYNPQGKGPVIGVISRYTEWKGIQYIVPAFREILKSYPDALLLLANAKGEYKNTIEAQLAQLPKDTYREIVFEERLASLYRLFDIFLHCPITKEVEAFGQIYVEALAAGIPSVVTLSGIANEFIEHEKNALVVRYKDSNEIVLAVNRILSDEALKQRLIHNGFNDVRQRFTIDTMIQKLQELYVR